MACCSYSLSYFIVLCCIKFPCYFAGHPPPKKRIYTKHILNYGSSEPWKVVCESQWEEHFHYWISRTEKKERGEYVDTMSWKEIIKTVTILVVILLYNYNKGSVGNGQNINRYRIDSHNLLLYPQQQLIRKQNDSIYYYRYFITS